MISVFNVTDHNGNKLIDQGIINYMKNVSTKSSYILFFFVLPMTRLLLFCPPMQFFFFFNHMGGPFGLSVDHKVFLILFLGFELYIELYITY